MGFGKSLTEILKQAQGQIKPVLDALAVKPPPVLYHYTKLSGFLGIVTSRVLWATDIRYLNDAKEFQYALDVTRDVLQKLLKRKTSPSFASRIPSLVPRIDQIRPTGVYVTCFTENGDLLSQWRGYAAPEVGCTIGWSAEILREAAFRRGLTLAPCIYSPYRQRKLLYDLLDRVFTGATSEELAGDMPAELIMRCVASIAPVFKHPSFREEDEWRLFAANRTPTKKDPLHFRLGRATLIPYTHIPMESEQGVLADVERIVVGPTALPVQSVDAVRACLLSAGVKVNAIDKSASPYRTT